ncbi:MAG: cytochrome b/b6 domain-containing protein [Pseudomonadota bacterium]
MSDTATIQTGSLYNSATNYGGIAKGFHWATALLILTAIPLGVVAYNWPYETSAQLAVKATLFSMHKTVGVAAFFVALGRILWALTQPKPCLLHPNRKLETFAAETVHWLLYASLVLVPLSGWIHHAASEGFAPIWWPLGQSLPLVPKSPAVSDVFGGMHFVFTKILAVSLVLHIAGAIKHAVIDKDATLARMLPLRHPDVTITDTPHRNTPVYAALGVWALAIALGTSIGLSRSHGGVAVEAVALEAAPSDWVVEDGSLGISVVNFGSSVPGEFADWTAAITFDPEADGPEVGSVDVQIAIGSLTVGTVTGDALGAEFLDAAGFPTASFTAVLTKDGDAYLAVGDLTIKGATAPLSLPFTLTLEGDRATMAGKVTLDRRDFGVGVTSYNDEASVGFGVEVDVALTAVRQTDK